MMLRKVNLWLVLGAIIVLVGIAWYSYAWSRLEIPVPVLKADGTVGAKFITIYRPTNLLAFTLVKVRGAVSPRDARYYTLAETERGQLIPHGPSPPSDLNAADCTPGVPLPADVVLEGVGPGDANAWLYRYADHNAVHESGCVRDRVNAGLSVDPCFLGPYPDGRQGKFIGQADGYPFVDPNGILDIPPGDPFALTIASMKVVPPQTERNEICSTQCSDGVDNDVPPDGLIDCADPDCHEGGNLANPCVPTDNSESYAASCGNGVVDPGEECDDGNTSNTDACLTTCVNAACGDGFVWEGVEQCDDSCLVGTPNVCETGDNFDACLASCQNNVCGDGFPERAAPVSAPGEPCDDGNTAGGDGCSGVCVTEDRYNCEWKAALQRDECTIPLGGV
jgi:cysteine-rich repeat protein